MLDDFFMPPWASMDWSLSLTRVLTLTSGERLETLRDAGELIGERFENTRQDAPLADAIASLVRAADTGTRADREAATDQVARLFRLVDNPVRNVRATPVVSMPEPLRADTDH